MMSGGVRVCVVSLYLYRKWYYEELGASGGLDWLEIICSKTMLGEQGREGGRRGCNYNLQRLDWKFLAYLRPSVYTQT